MKNPIRIAGLILVVLCAAPAAAPAGEEPPCPTVPQYLILEKNTEKWFTSVVPGKMSDLRMRTIVHGGFDGALVQEREILLGDEVIERHGMVFDRTETGDIRFHGDLEGRILAKPVLWVDAPLEIGKTWTDQTPLVDNGVDPTQVIHYVFACLETIDIVCPTGVHPAYRVFVATITPDGESSSCNFWYSETCGLVRCCMDNQRVFLLQKVNRGEDVDPGIDILDPLSTIDDLGLSSSPNPANPLTNIQFRLPTDSAVRLDVYDVSGRLVRHLLSGQVLAAGTQVVPWNGTDGGGRQVASGTYLYRVQARDLSETSRITLVR